MAKIEKLTKYTYFHKNDPLDELFEVVGVAIEAHAAKLNELIEAHNERESHDKDD